MMKPLYLVTSMVLATLILYLSGAFTQAEFDIRLWPVELRGFLAMIWVMVIALLALVGLPA